MVKYYSDREKKVISKAYDAIYDLKNVKPEYNDVLINMNKDALSNGYIFELDQKTQKFKLKKNPNPKDSPYYKGDWNG